MDIFEFAIQMEADGQKYYLDLASRTNHTALKNILTLLADDEVKHQLAIEDLRITNCEMTETRILDSAKNVFRQMRDFGGVFDLSGDEEQYYKQAMEMELKSQSFYLDKADQVATPEQKELFERLAEEEKKHYHLLSNLVDYAAAPNNWLADAEFEHLEEY